jgi:aldose 1-epimerase
MDAAATDSRVASGRSGAQPAVERPAQTAARPLSGQQWTISANGHEAVVCEVGGGLREYRYDGADLVDGYGPDELCPGSAGKVLAPWPNRLRDGRYTFGATAYQTPLTDPERHTAIHGLASWVRWRPVAVDADAVTLECDLVPQPGYPWPVLLWTTWQVGPAGLTVTHGATNTGTSAAPFGLAAHPYLRVPGAAVEDLTLEVPGHSRVLVDSRLLPIGTARVAGTDYDFTAGRRIGAAVLDAAFGDVVTDEAARSTVRLRGPDGTGLAVWADSTFSWWQVFTADTLSPPRRRRSVAIEPMTCPPDAFRSGRDVITLEPGQQWRGSWGVSPLAS